MADDLADGCTTEDGLRGDCEMMLPTLLDSSCSCLLAGARNAFGSLAGNGGAVWAVCPGKTAELLRPDFVQPPVTPGFFSTAGEGDV